MVLLGIEDLHFHDGRHEGTSQLFERGYQIHEVAQFTSHDSWNELKRYANLRPENVREIRRQQTNVVRFPGGKRTKDAQSISSSPAADRSAPQDPPH
jgi:hypothetical protein